MAKELRFGDFNPHKDAMIDRRAMIFLFVLLVGIVIAVGIIIALSG